MSLQTHTHFQFDAFFSMLNRITAMGTNEECKQTMDEANEFAQSIAKLADEKKAKRYAVIYGCYLLLSGAIKGLEEDSVNAGHDSDTMKTAMMAAHMTDLVSTLGEIAEVQQTDWKQ